MSTTERPREHTHGASLQPRKSGKRVTEKTAFEVNVTYSWSVGSETKRRTGFIRYYNPVDGRWINRDPIGERGGINLFGFISNRPVEWIDLLGLMKNKVPDDFGAKCCESEMKTISIVYNPTVGSVEDGSFKITSFGHAGLQTPTQTAGFSPTESASKENPNSPGSVHPEDPNGFSGKKDYRACPSSVDKLDKWIKDQKDKSPKYNAYNNGNRNCIGWACQGIKETGGKPPYDPQTAPLPINVGLK